MKMTQSRRCLDNKALNRSDTWLTGQIVPRMVASPFCHPLHSQIQTLIVARLTRALSSRAVEACGRLRDCWCWCFRIDNSGTRIEPKYRSQWPIRWEHCLVISSQGTRSGNSLGKLAFLVRRHIRPCSTLRWQAARIMSVHWLFAG